jgi:hypothetical protein
VPEFKPDHRSVLKAVQFLKQFADLALQLEIIASGDVHPTPFAAQSRDTHQFHIAIEDRLPIANRHILEPAKLVLVRQIHERALSSTQVLDRPRTLET